MFFQNKRIARKSLLIDPLMVIRAAKIPSFEHTINFHSSEKFITQFYFHFFIITTLFILLKLFRFTFRMFLKSQEIP